LGRTLTLALCNRRPRTVALVPLFLAAPVVGQ
jgi:hypothetical protein